MAVPSPQLICVLQSDWLRAPMLPTIVATSPVNVVPCPCAGIEFSMTCGDGGAPDPRIGSAAVWEVSPVSPFGFVYVVRAVSENEYGPNPWNVWPLVLTV